MTHTIELLNQVKAKYSLTTDYQLSKILGVSRARVSNWMLGKNSMEWDVAFKVADLLQIDDQNVVSCILHDKYENPRLFKALNLEQHA
ncbi:helix-turn-helix domain-containing protein [Photobacterium salinisoli]|uniref:helix-turn-helix domain-containing protein n=1 Tax=Photobacterium salinisoli TaxID=1616783 RepID=UPI000EA17A34|nr:helix-turn-helix transcriptional regulator [Photobacterium salinisoli]